MTSQKQATRKILDNVARNLQRISQITERIARARDTPHHAYQYKEEEECDKEGEEEDGEDDVKVLFFRELNFCNLNVMYNIIKF